MIKILSIGDSFSEDATMYLNDMSKLGEIDTKVVNLKIDGCTLETHWQNIISDPAAYEYQLNGDITAGKMISLHDALVEEDWDFVAMQQGNAESGIDTSYYPHIKNLSAFVKKFAPNAKQYVMQTWAYEKDCKDEAFELYEYDQQRMFRQLVLAYQGGARNIKAKIIPCGEIFQLLRAQEGFIYENAQQSLCCDDGMRADLVYGRYTLAATWYEMIVGGDITANYYLPPSQGKGVDQRLIDAIKRTIHTTIKR